MNKNAGRILRRSIKFVRSTRAATTIEFLVWIPLYLVLFMAIFEYGHITMTYAMLERGAHITSREARTEELAKGLTDVAEIETAIKTSVCDNTVIVNKEKCLERTKVSMEIKPFDKPWEPLPSDFDCEDNITPVPATFSTSNLGTSGELLVMRICLYMDAIFPTSRLSWGARHANEDGEIGLGTSVIYVVEPNGTP